MEKNKRMQFYGGTLGACAPLLVFMCLMIVIAAMKKVSLVLFCMAGFAGLCVAFLLAKNKKEFEQAVVDGLKNDTLCVIIFAFLLAGILSFVYVVLIKKDRLVPKMEAPKYLGAVCETAGQFAYIYAIADTEHLAMSAPIIASYCAASVLWSRIFLKEKLSWKHYAMIALVVIGIVMIGVFDI